MSCVSIACTILRKCRKTENCIFYSLRAEHCICALAGTSTWANLALEEPLSDDLDRLPDTVLNCQNNYITAHDTSECTNILVTCYVRMDPMLFSENNGKL